MYQVTHDCELWYTIVVNPTLVLPHVLICGQKVIAHVWMASRQSLAYRLLSASDFLSCRPEACFSDLNSPEVFSALISLSRSHTFYLLKKQYFFHLSQINSLQIHPKTTFLGLFFYIVKTSQIIDETATERFVFQVTEVKLRESVLICSALVEGAISLSFLF